MVIKGKFVIKKTAMRIVNHKATASITENKTKNNNKLCEYHI